MSSSDDAAAKKAAGQLDLDSGNTQAGHAKYQEGLGQQKADQQTGASG